MTLVNHEVAGLSDFVTALDEARNAQGKAEETVESVKHAWTLAGKSLVHLTVIVRQSVA